MKRFGGSAAILAAICCAAPVALAATGVAVTGVALAALFGVVVAVVVLLAGLGVLWYRRRTPDRAELIEVLVE